ncbi:MAG TPA: AraC family transcriptional regulator [Devosiaceae bacterium]|nr:AraC family transcriptional regulator [Devosiaceae bacterium]
MSTELLDAVRRYTDLQPGEAPFATAIEGVMILRSNQETRPNPTIIKPALCIVVQGAKWTTFGERRFEYRAGQALVVSVEMPSFGRVVEASPTEPFLAVVIELDLAVMRTVMEGLDTLPKPAAHPASSVFVTDFEGPLADCALRMMRLLATPQAIPMLYPGIMQEICYWLLTGPHGGEIIEMTMTSGHFQPVIRAIHVLRDRFATPVRIEELASVAQMSPSAFHRQFKALTSMTPLQYQKQLRLLEARRLMVSDALKPDTAAFRVGYESPSQFSREYARMFGAPPRRDTLSMLSRS